MRKLFFPKQIHIIAALVALWCSLISTSGLAQLVVVVNQNAPVTKLNMDELRLIFLGRLQLFPGTKVSISVLDQKETSPAFISFYEKVAKMSALELARYRASFLFSGRGRLPEVLDGDANVIEAVQRHQGAIGYVRRESVEGRSVRIIMEVP